MEKVIFSKGSVERAEGYNIVTNILIKDGKKIVQKRASNEMSKRHITMMYHHGNNFISKREDVKLAPCFLIEDGVVELPFIEGELFSDKIYSHIDCRDWTSLYRDIEELKDIVYSMGNVDSFELSPEFVNVFGCQEWLKGYKSSKSLDIDLLFENIIFSDGKTYIIDYEWIFDFSIPYKYIIFRTLFFDKKIQELEIDIKKKIMDIAEISEEEWKLFFEMELNFQRHIEGLSLDNLYQNMGKDTYIFDRNNSGICPTKISILDLSGNTILEKNTIEHDITIDLGDLGVREIQMNLAQFSIIVKIAIKGAHIVDNNAILNIIDDFYFDKNGWIKIVVDDCTDSTIRLNYIECNNDYIVPYAKCLLENEKNKNNIVLLEKELGSLKGDYSVYVNQYNDLYSKYLALGDEKGEVERQFRNYGDQYNELSKKYNLVNEKLNLIKNSKGWKIYSKLNHLD